VGFGDVKLFAVIVGTVIISIVMPMFGMYSVISGG
jgi:Flp pilus assembly protein protease CpaA